MKLTFPAFALLLLLSCSENMPKGIRYIKILNTCRADSAIANRYNKGRGLNDFILYQPLNDSLLIRVFEGADDSSFYSTYTGQLKNSNYRDSILGLIDSLKTQPSSFDFDTASFKSNYWGLRNYTEFEDQDGLHIYEFSKIDENKFSRYFGFFERLINSKWDKTKVSNDLIDADEEVVNALKNYKVYEKAKYPYIYIKCPNEIDMSKIFGTWRLVPLTKFPKDDDDYLKLTLTNDGKAVFEKIIDGTSTAKSMGSFLIDKQANQFIWTIKNDTDRYTIIKLTGNCFEFETLNKEHLIRYNRM